MALDAEETQILKMVGEGRTIQEMGDAVSKSVGAIFKTLTELEQQGLITPPIQLRSGKSQARSRQLTDLGKEYLRANRIVGDVFRT